MFKMKRNISLLLRAIISGALLFYVVQKIDWADFSLMWQKVDYYYLLIAFSIFGMAFFAAAMRWYFLLRIQDIKLSMAAVTLLTFIGAFFNSFLLGSTGGDVAKLVYIFKKYPDKKTDATMSVIIDRVLGLAVLLLIAIIFIAFKAKDFIGMPQIHSAISGILISFVLLLLMAFFMLKMPFEKLPVFFQDVWQKMPLNNVFSGLLLGYRQHQYATGKLIYATISSGIVQILVFSSAYFLTQAINLNVSFMDLSIIIAIVTCIISLPISIGGHGVREGAFLLMFSLFSLANENTQYFDKENIILFSVLYFILGAGWSVVGGVIYLLFDPVKVIGYTDKFN